MANPEEAGRDLGLENLRGLDAISRMFPICEGTAPFRGPGFSWLVKQSRLCQLYVQEQYEYNGC